MSIAIHPAAAGPSIIITERDLDRLDRLATLYGDLGYPVARFLSGELERATVCGASEVPDDVVTMNSRVVFRIGSGAGREHRILVYPEDYPDIRRRDAYVSVLTPVGAALIGLRVGSGMEYEALNGRRQFVTVEGLPYQPEAEERRGGAAMPVSGCTDEDDPGPDAA